MRSMMTGTYDYNTDIIEGIISREMTAKKIGEALREYLSRYTALYGNKAHAQQVEKYIQGLMSGAERKSIEPIALANGGGSTVRGMQHFLSRSTFQTERVKESYQSDAVAMLCEEDGMLSVDESDFVKKGDKSPGVARQYCGRLGKRENCQAGVFIAYASEEGHALLDGKLYMPKKWFEEEYSEKRAAAKVPNTLEFKTKNAMAIDMLANLVEKIGIRARWIGCDASFGSDHGFLDSIPEGMMYFASVRKNENIFRMMPDMILPESKRNGGKYKRLRPSIEPVHVETVATDDTVAWQRVYLADSAKGPIYADVKRVRCVSSTASYSGKSGKVRMIVPGEEVWLYIRRHADGCIKYFLSNAPANIDSVQLDRASILRWPIEQCFEECKGCFGMADYESRTYCAWERHMLFVMMAHFFATCLRLSLKKTSAS